MDAIDDLIEQHSPDLICFQEVTAKIYAKLCQSSWWKVYQCAFSREKMDRKLFYCVLLSKLQVSSTNCVSFRNSKTGRKLCIVEVKVQEDKSLVVATTHQESPLDPCTTGKKLSKEPAERPCLSPPTWDQKLCRERVEQAREAINRLENNQNVIFCGDLNWDDKLDGRFPLPEGWMYVTRPNQMSGNGTLQKQLDRFICNLRDFKISRIDMMGMEAIPGHWREKKEMKLELPVSPSDHYRLLLTINSQ
ncbi:uncharacterized protein LOC116142936 [Pistacia vera]|uniref:uncharacterized protein LOC116142936 n=1 Tax=Pistacia vera TaxID=55513 RepID=UPI00126335CA|nr:uncharacterized protein LOC116142936 [Pistacia vera]